MADVNRTIDLIFGGKDSGASAAISKISTGLDDISTMADKIAAPLAKMSDYVVGADLALATLAAGGIALATRAAGQFDEQIAFISTHIKDTNFNLEEYKTQVLDYATKSQFSIDTITASLEQATDAGIDYSKSIEFIAAAEKLAIATKSELSDSTMLMAQTMNAFGASADEAGKYAEIFFKITENGTISVEELKAGFGKITGTAQGVKLPIEEIGAAIAALSAQGVPTRNAFSSINSAIDSIINPSEEAREMAKNLGIQFDATALQTKGLSGVFQEVWQKSNGNVEVFNALFGSINGLNGAFLLAKDSSGIFNAALQDMRSNTAALDAAYGKMAVNFTNINQNIANNVSAVLIMVGEKIIGNYQGLASGLVSILQAIQKSVSTGAFDPLFKLIDEAGISVTAFLNNLAKNLPEAFAKLDFTNLIDSLKKFGVEIVGIFDIDVNDPEQLASALQKIVDACTGLVNVTRGMVDFVKPIFQYLAQAGSDLSQTGEDAQMSFGRILAAGKMVSEFGLYTSGLVIAMSESGISLMGIIDGIIDVFKILGNEIGIVIDFLIFTIVDFAQNTLLLPFEVLDEITGGSIDSLHNMTTAVEEFKQGSVIELQDRLETVGKAGKDLWNWDKETENAKQKITGVSNHLKTTIPDKYPTEIDAYIDAQKLSDTGEILKDTISRSVSTEVKIDYADAIIQVDGIVTYMARTIPDRKELTIEPKLDLSKLDDANLVRVFEIKSKIDIAQIEADTSRVEAAFNSVNTVFQSTAEVISSLSGALAGLEQGTYESYAIIDLMEEESARRQEALENQTKLTEAQIDYMAARTKAMESGQALISISGEGLQPELEAFMWKIIDQVQIRANAEGSDFLLGVT
jgi:TP901 family phage tail tape measure protein